MKSNISSVINVFVVCETQIGDQSVHPHNLINIFVVIRVFSMFLFFWWVGGGGGGQVLGKILVVLANFKLRYFLSLSLQIQYYTIDKN